jgi:hypothetical protein
MAPPDWGGAMRRFPLLVRTGGLMRSVLKSLASAAVAVVTLLTFAQPASAVGSISIDEGSSFAQSQVITVRYKGYPLYERIFVQQCWDDPASPTFDFGVSCAVSNMLAPGLIDRDEGTYEFKLFVGDEPSGAQPVSCGPNVNPENLPHTTCWIRAVMTARERNELSAWVPVTFENAKPSAATTAPPRTTVAGEPSADTAATTVAAASATSGPTVGVSPQAVKKSRSVVPYIVGGGALAGAAIVFASKRRRRIEPPLPT